MMPLRRDAKRIKEQIERFATEPMWVLRGFLPFSPEPESARALAETAVNVLEAGYAQGANLVHGTWHLPDGSEQPGCAFVCYDFLCSRAEFFITYVEPAEAQRA